jgi:fructosamine-3-kinase
VQNLHAVEDAILAALAGTHGQAVTVLDRTPLGGGSINSVERLQTNVGAFVLKTRAAAPRGFFRAEADSLNALRASGAALTVPRVIACATAMPDWLLLEYLSPPNAGRVRDFDDRLGRGLASLHRATAARFGFESDNYCGTTVQQNTWHVAWVEFYAEMRLGVQIRLARDSGWLSRSETAACDRLRHRLADWIAEPSNGPSLLHGDLWSGNLHTDASGGPVILDPAVYYGHREAELGMMTLFGGFGARVFAAYHEAFPLEAGWRERNPLYQLYHVLNHLNLFGAAYHAQTMSIVQRFS